MLVEAAIELTAVLVLEDEGFEGGAEIGTRGHSMT
jgi:hypothetical protein